MRSCTHKTYVDHAAGRGAEGRLLWKCSDCGLVGSWQDGWKYLGNIECPRCQRARVDRVTCPRCSPSDPKTPPKDSVRVRSRYQRLRDAGLCVDCAGKGRPGVLRCRVCEDKRTAAARRRG